MTTSDPDEADVKESALPERWRAWSATGPSVADGGSDDGEDDLPTTLLFMEPGENRRLLAELLDGSHEVVEADRPADLTDDFDLCVVDGATFGGHRDALVERKTEADPAFLPVLLVARQGNEARANPGVWDVVDDVVSTPVRKAELHARMTNLLSRRRDSLRLLDRERRLEETLAELRVKERAMDAAPVGITITDPDCPDNPLVYVNEAFEALTGYDGAACLGRNCRFLQGPETDPGTTREMRRAIDAGEPTSVELVNYRADGSRFWNRVDVAPVFDGDDVTNYVGFQTDVTGRKIREQRLSVLDRVLRHNLRNDMGVVKGYAERLAAELDDPDHLDYVAEIQGAASDLTELSDAVHDVEKALRGMRSADGTVAVGPALERAVEKAERAVSRRPVDLHLPERPLPAVPEGVGTAFEHAVELAIDLGGPDDERPRVRAARAPTRDGEVVVEVQDRGRGVPESVQRVIAAGEETPLHHTDGLDLWLIDWVTRIAGGNVEIGDAEGPGSTIRFRLPGVEDDGEAATDGRGEDVPSEE